jgi:hypothetical protein
VDSRIFVKDYSRNKLSKVDGFLSFSRNPKSSLPIGSESWCMTFIGEFETSGGATARDSAALPQIADR